jgi:uncharacterized lipoprotein YmbA
MNRTSRIIGAVAFLVAIMPFLTACGTSPSSRYYALSSMTTVNQPPEKMQNKDVIVVAVGHIGIPEYLDRQEIVTRDSRNKLTLGDFDLWGGSLESDVSRVLVDNLSVLLTQKGINIVSWRARVPFTHTITISMTRFEAAGDVVILKAQWGIIEQGGQAAETIKESVITKPLAGKEYDDVVAAMSDALADLSKEIAIAVEKAVEKARSTRK